MGKIRIMIEDDDGNLIEQVDSSSLDFGSSLHDIEEAVEKFRIESLPRIEQALLEEQQREFLAQKKRKKSGRPTDGPTSTSTLDTDVLSSEPND